MWEPVVRAAADVGRRAVAPDLPGYGDSPPDSPGTWERHIEAIERVPPRAFASNAWSSDFTTGAG